jgi:hypothetical protein
MFSTKFGLQVLGCAAVGCVLTLQAAPPLWWQDRKLVNPAGTASDYAPANIGQLKTLAFEAIRQATNNETALVTNNDFEFDDNSGIAAANRALLDATATSNFRIAAVGEAKWLAKPLYQHSPLLAPGVLPLTGGAASDYSPVTVGQVKRLFAYEVPTRRLQPDINRQWLGTDPGNPWQMPQVPTGGPGLPEVGYEREFSHTVGSIPFLTPANFAGNRNPLVREVVVAEQIAEQIRAALVTAVPAATWQVIPTYTVPVTDVYRHFVDIYLDTPDRQLYHNSESLRVRMRFSDSMNGGDTAYDNLREYIEQAPRLTPDGARWNRLEVQAKVQFRPPSQGPSLPYLTFPVPTSQLAGYYEILQARHLYRNEDTDAFPSGQSAGRNMHILANRAQQGNDLRLATDGPPQNPPATLRENWMEPYRHILKARLGSAPSNVKLSFMPEAVLITSRGRFQLMGETDGDLNPEFVFIITVDHTFAFDPVEIMTWMRNWMATTPPEPRTNFLEVETQIEDTEAYKFFNDQPQHQQDFQKYMNDLVTLTNLVKAQFPMTVSVTEPFPIGTIQLNTGNVVPRAEQKYQTACRAIYPQLK